MAERALVAMSGGVDSSVSAFLTLEKGYETSGATMILHKNKECEDYTSLCSSNKDVEDAKKVSSRLGIDHFVYDFTEDFEREVIDRFIKSYESGETPNPCIDCNRELKFNRLYNEGVKNGNNLIVTGHYAVIQKDSGSNRYLLKEAIDSTKDQSYVLYNLTQNQLAHTNFPLGSMSKSEVREIAKEQGFVNAQKKESQDICFIPDGDYASYITEHTGKNYPPGNFVDLEGNVLGKHKGIIHYTIGQRKGLGLALKHPMYVCFIDIKNNLVVLGSNDDLFTRELEASSFNWISCAPPTSDMRVLAKIRYKHKKASATVIPIAEDKVKVIFDEPQRAVTSGQAVVLYDDDFVVGGGTIL